METRTWIVRYVAYSGDIVRARVDANIDAEEWEIVAKLIDSECGYSSNYFYELIDVSIDY